MCEKNFKVLRVVKSDIGELFKMSEVLFVYWEILCLLLLIIIFLILKFCFMRIVKIFVYIKNK